ncbi:MAG: aminopeptidase P family protein [Gemmatimonadaceae bacterium]|nr:aminopeptidase P family protein [Gemmatimonadaceae bacterium]
MSNRREFVRTMGLSLAASAAASAKLAALPFTGPGEGSERLLVRNSHHPEPAPVGVDRLPLSWYQQTTQRLRAAAKAKGVDAILLQTDTNLVYFTGCFRGSGERTTWALFMVDEPETIYWFSPSIDRDLITSWWCTENTYYFCYPHAAGGFPNRGANMRGERVDLWTWVLTHLRERGLAGKTIGLERELTPSSQRTFSSILPGSANVDISDICLGMRIIKTPEEIALIQRAYRYFDKVHAFARDYILEHGTNATDYEVGQALSSYGINLMMRDVKRDGKPHSAVGIEVTGNYVRAGVATAYPHPNQFFHTKLQRGQPVYVNCDILLGGFGGEGYRNYIITPSTQHHDRMWQVVADTVQIMTEETKPGAICSDIAQKVHAHQIKSGMQDFIYHRPGHGQGTNFEGHQAPFIALGDDTVVQEGMTFSVEPGLYDAQRGIGINPSDRLLVTKDRGVRMSSIPFSREWSYLTL